MKKRQRILALVLAVVFLVSSFGFTGIILYQIYQDSKGDSPQQTANNNSSEAAMTTQLENFEPVNNVTELQVTDLKEGTGAEVKADSTLVVHYTGAVASTGKVFESSYNSGQPATLNLAMVIEGWSKGLPGMKAGGQRRLVIPAELAYGDQSPSPDIPANSALVFDVEVLEVQ